MIRITLVVEGSCIARPSQSYPILRLHDVTCTERFETSVLATASGTIWLLAQPNFVHFHLHTLRA